MRNCSRGQARVLRRAGKRLNMKPKADSRSRRPQVDNPGAGQRQS